jgi:hypothetical protein
MTKKRKRNLLSKRKQPLFNTTADLTCLGLQAERKALQNWIEEMARDGLVEDQIAARLGLDKNQLRRLHIDAIKQGRAQAMARVAAIDGEQLSVDEETMRKALFAGYGTPWENEDGANDAQQGRALAQAKILWVEWLRRARAGSRVLPSILAQELFP